MSEGREEGLAGRVQALESRLDMHERALGEVAAEVRRWARWSPGKAEKRDRLRRNVAVGLSLASIGAGCWWVYPPLALLAVGGIVFAGCCVGMVLSFRNRRQPNV